VPEPSAEEERASAEFEAFLHATQVGPVGLIVGLLMPLGADAAGMRAGAVSG
jgi:hypothetical protein